MSLFCVLMAVLWLTLPAWSGSPTAIDVSIVVCNIWCAAAIAVNQIDRRWKCP